MFDNRRQNLPKSGSSILIRLLRSELGGVLPLMAFSTILLVAMVGAGVDMARGYKAERRLQAACDAGALAGRRAVTTNGFDDPAKAQAQTYFNANFDADEQRVKNVKFTTTTPDKGDTVNGVASGDLHTMMVRYYFNVDAIPLQVECSASMGMGNADIMFVLDNTYSMTLSAGSESRISALKKAMMNFYNTVDTASKNTNARIRYGFVPYATTVNVGEILRARDASFIADSITVPSVRLVRYNTTPIRTWSDATPSFTNTTVVSDWARVGNRYNTTDACTAALPNPNPTAWANQGAEFINTTTYSVVPTSGNQLKTMGMRQEQRRTEYQCNSRYRETRTVRRYEQTIDYEERTVSTTGPVNTTTGDGVAHNQTFTEAILQDRTFSTVGYKTGAATAIPIGVVNDQLKSDYDDTSTWQGCIAERQTTPAASFTFVNLLTGITPGGATDLDIDTAPTGTVTTKWSPLWPEVMYRRDPDIAFEGISDNNSLTENMIAPFGDVATYCPYKAQLLKKMSYDDFDTYVKKLETSSLGTYHDTGLLWGARLSSPTGIFSTNVNEAATNGATVSRHMIFMTDGTPQPSESINAMYGIETMQERITGNWVNNATSYDTLTARHQARAWALCEAIKARGIRLWVIAFGTPLTDEMDGDDGDGCSSPKSAFPATDTTSLNAAFQSIAKQVGELRVTQ